MHSIAKALPVSNLNIGIAPGGRGGGNWVSSGIGGASDPQKTDPSKSLCRTRYVGNCSSVGHDVTFERVVMVRGLKSCDYLFLKFWYFGILLV